MNEGCKFWDGDTNYEFHNPDNFSTQHYRASGITITQKAYAGIWPSKMKNNGLHFPSLSKDQNMEDRIVYILFPWGLSWQN